MIVYKVRSSRIKGPEYQEKCSKGRNLEAGKLFLAQTDRKLIRASPEPKGITCTTLAVHGNSPSHWLPPIPKGLVF